MTKAKIKEIVTACMKNRVLCRVFLRYNAYYTYYFPLLASDKLFLGAKEDDFILDGYTVRQFKDVTKAQIKNDMCNEILIKEGIVDSIVMPEIDLTDWQTVFSSLQKRNKNIIVEKESIDEDECEFYIGRIESVYKKFVYVRHFDADGVWQDEPYKIPYTEITSITFDSRYINIYSKYLSDLPENFGR
ncbi:MAG: hypothetical protein VB106_06305 [Clostridiaceae bacterium]|jgi:hypothetical protein|nr:hypothetical protein [Clostridiaceae bacterium]